MKDIKLVVGSGENHFSMSRGSFDYQQEIHWKAECVLESKKETENGTELHYRDKKFEKEHVLRVEEQDTKTEITYISDDFPQIDRFWVTFDSNTEEHIYGCGETYSEFDLKGQKIRIWVAEHQNAKRISEKVTRGKREGKKLPFDKYESYYAQPTFVSSDCYFVHVFTNTFSEFDFSKKDEITLYLQEKPHIIIEKAENFEELSYKLSNLLGRQRKLPDWVYEGGILAMQDWFFDGKVTAKGYDGCGNIDRKIAMLEKNNAPIVGVWSQDWCGCRCTQFGYQVMWNWKYSEEQYPNLPAKIEEWKQKGIHFLGYINPFIAIEKEIYKEAKEKGYCVKDKNGDDYLVTITTFPAAMVDLTNPAAYEWYKDIIKNNLIGIGMSGWMADFGEYLPVDAVLYNGNPEVLHNQWPAIWAKLNREAIEESGKSDDIFFFTRAGHTGTVKESAMMWTGDQHVDWSGDDGIGSVIPATLSLAMSGFGITHSDVGGYTTMESMRRTKELLMRWEEMNVFSPLFRSHEGNQPANNVQFSDDDELLETTSRCLKQHKLLSGYLKKCVDETVKKGIPVIRPLFYYYAEEPAYTEVTEYLLGREILVAPVIESGKNSRKVFLPEDSWIHVFSGKEYRGGYFTVDSPIGEPPVFFRKEYAVSEEGKVLLSKLRKTKEKND